MIKAIFNALFPKAAELSKMARELVAKELERTGLECENKSLNDALNNLGAAHGRLSERLKNAYLDIKHLEFKIICIEEPEKEEDVIQAPEKPYRSKADVEIDKYLADKLINEIEQNGDK